MALEFGLRRGLAVPVDFNRMVDDEKTHYLINKAAQTEAQAKAKLFADDFDYNNAINQYDNPIIKEGARSKVKDIGSYIRQNPDWNTNVGKYMQYKMMVKDLKDNPDLMRGIQTDANIREYQQWRTKNPELANSPEGVQTQATLDNYLKAAPGTNKNPWSFVPPELFDDEKYLRETFTPLQTREHELTHKDYKGAIGSGATIAKVEDVTLRNTAMSVLSDPKVAYKMDAIWKNKLTPEQRAFWGDQMSWIAQRGKAYTKQDIKPGEFHEWMFNGGGGGAKTTGWSAFEHQIMKSPEGAVRTSPFLKTVSPLQGEDEKGNGTLNLPTGTPVRVMYETKDGKKDWKIIQGLNGRDVDATRTDEYMMYQGQPLVKVRIKVPLDAEHAGDIRGLYDHNYWFQPGSKFEEKPEYSNVAKVMQDNDGKPTKTGVVETWIPAHADFGNQLLFDKVATGEKQADAVYPGVVNDRTKPAGTYDSFKQAGYTDDQINYAAKQGAIRLTK